MLIIFRVAENPRQQSIQLISSLRKTTGLLFIAIYFLSSRKCKYKYSEEIRKKFDIRSEANLAYSIDIIKVIDKSIISL